MSLFLRPERTDGTKPRVSTLGKMNTPNLTRPESGAKKSICNWYSKD